MIGGATYSPSLDQPALTSLFDLKLAASRSDSFEKCFREIKKLIEALQRLSSDATSGGGGS
jgi:primosomal protein N''